MLGSLKKFLEKYSKTDPKMIMSQLKIPEMSDKVRGYAMENPGKVAGAAGLAAGAGIGAAATDEDDKEELLAMLMGGE